MDHRNAGAALGQRSERSAIAWEWWVVILAAAYFLAALIPWAQDGFRVVGQ